MLTKIVRRIFLFQFERELLVDQDLIFYKKQILKCLEQRI